MAEKPSKAKRSGAKRAARAKASSSGSAGASARSRSDFPDRIFANASPHSIGGVSLFEAGVVADAATVGNFASDPDLIGRAVNLLADAGFEVLQATSLMINFAGSRATFEKAFATTLVAEERPVVKAQGREELATFIDSPDTDVPGLVATGGTRFEEVLEGVAIEEPVYLATPTSFPPPKAYFHLDVPADVSLGCNADKAHRGGITGLGVNVAMVDTGWQTHPWFTDRGYRVNATILGPGTADPGIDEVGHGTGESANIFCTAPDCTLTPIKAANSAGALVNTTAAFNAAAALNPDIITNSWTGNVQNGPLSAAQQAQAAAVAAAWAAGIIVVFAAGNGHWGFPGQHPDVISVGGVSIDQAGALRASDYASGFDSNVYPGRRVPDLSGLVGMRPGAQLIMLPVPEGCQLDVDEAGGTHPNGDETATNDGWAAFSGTSAATPQVAGVCALIRQACPRLTPPQVRDILMSTARDVTTGTNHPNFGNTAVVGPDNATGNGLVDANKAVLLAKLRCIATPIIPFQPPLIPFQPPLQPFQPPLIPFQPPLIPFQPPLQPFQPPVRPLFPTRPLQPFQPLRPLQPLQPLAPLPPIQPFAPFGPGPGPDPSPLSAEDLAAIERMIIESDDPQL
jgi:subtilisin family serine protease